MKISGKEFLTSKHKAITLLGMSGVGKTHLSGLLENWGWARYSCDYAIGHQYLAPHLNKAMKNAEDINILSTFIGKPGKSAHGGLNFETFKARQILYYEAECAAIEGAVKTIPANQNFVHDSTGSLCEILNEVLLEKLGSTTLFVYLKADKTTEEKVLERAMQNPKPLFYPPFQLESWVGNYLEIKQLDHPDEMVPDEFARWVFPKLFTSRLPKYQRLAEMYGVTIPCEAMLGVKSELEAMKVIADFLK